jgi:DNA-binding transcriptional LysR family regulator
MDLHALADFNLVAQHGGFGRASRSSGRPKATLSRRVSELEARLGIRLIDRGSRTLRLTDEGRALHELTTGPLAEIAEAEQAVTAGASVPKGRLRVSAPIVLAQVLLPMVAASFVLTYPQVDLEIVAEDRKVDPVEENFDLVIRVDPDHDERLVGRRIVEDERILVAAPGGGRRPAARAGRGCRDCAGGRPCRHAIGHPVPHQDERGCAGSQPSVQAPLLVLSDGARGGFGRRRRRAHAEASCQRGHRRRPTGVVGRGRWSEGRDLGASALTPTVEFEGSRLSAPACLHRSTG